MHNARFWKRLHDWVPPQPLTAALAALLAAASLAWAWGLAPWPTAPAAPAAWAVTALISVFLVTLLVWAGTHPLHLRHKTKVHLTTLPLYLIALLLPPPVAAAVAGLGVLGAQLRMRPQTGNFASDIATAVSRWVFIVGLASAFAHGSEAAASLLALRLCGTAALMFALDVLTCAFELAPMTGEPPLKIMQSVVREGGQYEAAQYVTAILAGAAGLYQIWTLALLVLPVYLIYAAFRNAKEVHDGTYRLLESLADAVDLRDPYTGGHSRRVAEWTARILQEVNLHGPEADLIRTAARVHDLGKIGVPDHILNKTGQLTPEEKAIMDSHPAHGAELLARFAEFAHGQAIVRHHHERWDGAGYPDQLHDWDIPFGARVIAVADSFDAMTSDRPYRPALSVGQASAILRAGRDQQWDPSIVDALLRCLETAPNSEAARPPARVTTPAPGAVAPSQALLKVP